MQLLQICGSVLPVSHILVTLFISSTTTGSYAVVACKRCLCHTGKNIAEAIQATLEAWDLQETCQVCITTDNGSTIINAAERLQMTRLVCFGHNLHLGVINALKDDSRLSLELWVYVRR